MKKLICLIVLFLSANPASSVITVGADVNCDFDNLTDAYNDPDPFVRVVSQIVFTDKFNIKKPKFFYGGYDNCTDAANNVPGTARSLWQGNNNNVVTISNGAQNVVINQFEIYDGDESGLAYGGGVDITGDVSVLISNSVIRNNVSQAGAGIYVLGDSINLQLVNVEIHNNTAEAQGGGIGCNGNSEIRITGTSAIHHNQATKGGGIHAAFNCQITSESGDGLTPVQVQAGIFANTAEQGGGVFLSDGAQMSLKGDAQNPATLAFNISTIQGFSGGGGFYIDGLNSRLEAEKARIVGNIAETFGGGGSINSGTFNMRRGLGACWDESRCNELSNNIVTAPSGSGAALNIVNGSVYLSQSMVQNNWGNWVAVMSMSHHAYARLEGNLISGNRHFNDDGDTVLFQLAGGSGFHSNLDFFYNTAADNQAHHVFQLLTSASHFLSVHNSIIRNDAILDERGIQNNTNQFDCLLLTEHQSLSGNLGVLSLQDPLFTDSNNGDYRPTAQSPAIDMCDETTFNGAQFRDLDNQNRGFDDPGQANHLGPFDAGAYEQVDDLIFAHDFE